MKAKKRGIGTAAAAVGLALNLLLAAAKIAAGALTGLIAVSADGLNNLSDCGSGVLSLFSLRLAEKPADSGHPYGHQRFETVASMGIAFLILLLAVGLCRESVGALFSEAEAAGGWPVLLVLASSVAVKAGMFFFYRYAAKKAASETLRAASVDSACDCLATFAAAVGVLLTPYWRGADGWAGIAVALFIGWEGGRLLFDAGSRLLGKAPDGALTEELKRIITSPEEVLGIHDLRVFSYGPDHCYATVHLELDAALSSVAAHEIADAVERETRERLGVDLTAHCDPIVLGDEETERLKRAVEEELGRLHAGLDVHDFRLVRGAKTKLVFEIGVPYDCPLGDGEIGKRISDAVAELGDYVCDLTVERK